MSTTTYNVQGLYLSGKELKKLFRIIPSSFPAHIIIGNRFANTNLTLADDCTVSYEYSYDGVTWQTVTFEPGWTISNGKIDFTVNAPIYLRNKTMIGENYSWAWKLSNNAYVTYVGIDCSVNFSVSGKVTKLVENITPSYLDSTLRLFYAVYTLTDASKLDFSDVADQTITANNYIYHYDYMFYNCINLVNGPTDLYLPQLQSGLIHTQSLYTHMFQGCVKLTNCPNLHGSFTSGSGYIKSAYSYLCGGCTSLTSVPDLNDLVLAPGCYQGMFAGTNLRVTTTSGSGTLFRIPKTGTGSVLSGYEIGDCTRSMFSDLPPDGESDGYVDINTDYYVYLNS